MFTSTPANKWVEGNTLKALKIKLYPTTIQRKIKNEIFNTTRYVYNKTVECIKNGHEISFQSLRNKLVTVKNNPLINDWETDIHKDIRAGAVNDVVKAYKTCFQNLKRNNISNFKIGFKSRKKPTDSVCISKSSISIKDGKIVFCMKTHKVLVEKYNKEINTYNKTHKRKKKIITELSMNYKVGKRTNIKNIVIKNDCRLCKDGKDMYIIIPVEAQKTEISNKKICSLDPGSRTFMTGYDIDGRIIEINKQELIDKFYKKIQLLQSKRIKQKTINKYYKKIKNNIDELHWKSIKFITKNYEVILLPHFESQKMISNKKLHKSTNRNIQTLSHFTFKTRLIYKCSLIKNSKLFLVDESYTSKTCGKCGVVNNIGSSKTFRCKGCNYETDRDHNASRNILIKNWYI